MGVELTALRVSKLVTPSTPREAPLVTLMSADVTLIVGARTVPRKFAVPPAAKLAVLAVALWTERPPPDVTVRTVPAVKFPALRFPFVLRERKPDTVTSPKSKSPELPSTRLVMCGVALFVIPVPNSSRVGVVIVPAPPPSDRVTVRPATAFMLVETVTAPLLPALTATSCAPSRTALPPTVRLCWLFALRVMSPLVAEALVSERSPLKAVLPLVA